MTIEYLELFNFESHKSNTLTFDPGVNIITGLSGHGKSGIIRGFNWVVSNSPTGESMLSYSSDGICSSGISFNEGRGVARIRGDKMNGYFLTEPEEEFKALRGKVPETVSTLCNMDSVNIQRQKDFYFMLDDSPGHVAKMFNKVSGLEEMDLALEAINSMYRKKKKKFDSLFTRADELQERLSDINWIEGAHTDWANIESLELEIHDYEEEYEKIEEVLKSIDSIQCQIDSCGDTSAIPFIEEILKLDDENWIISDKMDKIQKLLSSCSQLKKDIKGISLPTKGELSSIESLAERIDEIRYDIEDINETLVSIVLYKSHIKEAEATIGELNHHYAQSLVECGKCPTCGRKI